VLRRTRAKTSAIRRGFTQTGNDLPDTAACSTVTSSIEAPIFQSPVDAEPLAKHFQKLGLAGLGIFIPQAVEHQTPRPIEELQALAHFLFARHLAGAFDLLAGAGVHHGDLLKWVVFSLSLPRSTVGRRKRIVQPR
jgi:hypothetical protein